MFTPSLRSFIACSLLAALAGAALGQTTGFHYIGALGGQGQEVAVPFGIGPGPVVYGTNDYFSNKGNFRRAWVWSEATGMDPLAGTAASGTASGLYAVSPDGGVVVGVLGINPGSSGPAAQVFRRVDAGANQTLALVPGMTYPQVTGISDDGAVTVGIVNGYGGGGRAVQWVGASAATMLSNLPDAPSAQALGVNADGSVIVGWSGRGYPFDNMPVRWVNGQPEALGLPPGCGWGWAKAVSADGQTVVGLGWVGGNSRAFKWTPTTGMTLLPTGSGSFGEAVSISADGRIIAGRTAEGSVLWRDGVLYNVQAELIPPGTSLSPFGSLAGNPIISRDGHTIACSERVIEAPGDGEYHAWAIVLPEWFTCLPPAITTPAESQSVCVNGAASFSLGTSGAPAIYQWSVESPENSGQYVDLAPGTFSEPDSGLSVDVSGAASSTLNISGVRIGSHAPSLKFVGHATNACGSVASDPATLTICLADVTCSDGVDLADFFQFLGDFDQTLPGADVNGDASVDLADFFAFLSAFDSGC